MSRLILLAALGIAALFLVGCSDDEPDEPPAPAGQIVTLTPADGATPDPGSITCPDGAEPGLSVEALTSDGVERSYRLYIPASYNASEPLPLVLSFHGLGSSAREHEDYTGLVDVAETNDFVLVTPDGTNEPKRWYIYGGFEREYVDDFAFVENLIDDLSARVCIDPDRIYATGISNGGGLASLLGCSSDRIAAIAPVAGAPFSNARCRPDNPVPVIAFHGTDDYVIPFTTNDGVFSMPITTVRENMQAWAEHNGCDPTLQTERVAEDVVLESYTNCDDNADVQLYVIEDGGHTWPGATLDFWLLGRTTQSINASELIWTFFESHAR